MSWCETGCFDQTPCQISNKDFLPQAGTISKTVGTQPICEMSQCETAFFDKAPSQLSYRSFLPKAAAISKTVGPDLTCEMSQSETGFVDKVPCLISNEEFLPQAVTITKIVGGIGNFWASYTFICKMLFDYCTEVSWNALFYDTIAEYVDSWRRRKVWSGVPKSRFLICESNFFNGLPVNKPVSIVRSY